MSTLAREPLLANSPQRTKNPIRKNRKKRNPTEMPLTHSHNNRIVFVDSAMAIIGHCNRSFDNQTMEISNSVFSILKRNSIHSNGSNNNSSIQSLSREHIKYHLKCKTIVIVIFPIVFFPFERWQRENGEKHPIPTDPPTHSERANEPTTIDKRRIKSKKNRRRK